MMKRFESKRARGWVRGLSLMSLSLMLGGCLDGDLDGGIGVKDNKENKKDVQDGYQRLEPATWYHAKNHRIGYIKGESLKKTKKMRRRSEEEFAKKNPWYKNHPHYLRKYGDGHWFRYLSDEEGLLNHQLKINSDKTITWKVRTGDKEQVENKRLDRVIASYSYNFEGSLIGGEKGRSGDYKKFELKTTECNEGNYPELLKGNSISLVPIRLFERYKSKVIANYCQDGKTKKYLMTEEKASLLEGSKDLDEYFLVIFNVYKDQESEDKYPTLGEVKKLLSEKYYIRYKDLKFRHCIDNLSSKSSKSTCFIRFKK